MWIRVKTFKTALSRFNKLTPLIHKLFLRTLRYISGSLYSQQWPWNQLGILVDEVHKRSLSSMETLRRERQLPAILSMKRIGIQLLWFINSHSFFVLNTPRFLPRLGWGRPLGLFWVLDFKGLGGEGFYMIDSSTARVRYGIRMELHSWFRSWGLTRISSACASWGCICT